jgi:REP element-mobilizing transposase RayT
MATNPQMKNLLYKSHNLCPAYQLRYGWTGWPSQETIPPIPSGAFFQEISELWKKDGLRLLEKNWGTEHISFTFSTTPTVSPVFLAGRVKGRVQHALRLAGQPVKFSRKLAVRSIGRNTREIVEGYIKKQIDRDRPADPRYEELLRSQTINNQSVDLSHPFQTGSGRYWYNLHLVLVVQGRYRMGWGKEGRNIAAACREVERKNGYRISTLSAMPEHLHIALRGNVDESPEDIALAFQNYLAYAMGGFRLWEDNYYVGTFGEYTMNAVRVSR